MRLAVRGSLLWMLLVGAYLAFAGGCRRAPANPVLATDRQPEAQSSQPAPFNADEQSCKAFVQSFYDWYWNRFAERVESPNFDLRELPREYDVVHLKPPVLTPDLIKLFKRDEAAAKAAGGIANLDFDPFLNSQDPQGKYIAFRVKVTDGVCSVSLSRRDVVAELKKRGSSWRFSNFHYSFFSDDGKTRQAPDSDLIQILNQ